MLQNERFITLNLRSRPLRLAYLVTCVDDLKDAVKLYTHTWGGAANALLPVFDDEKKIQQLKNALIKFDPDYILSTEGKDLPLRVKQIFDSYPALHRPIRHEDIDKFVDNTDNIDFIVGNLNSRYRVYLPHIISVLRSLYPSGLSDSNICIIESSSSKFDLELSLQGGITSQFYRSLLTQYLGAKTLLSPQNPENLCKVSILISFMNPVLLTLKNIKRQQRGGIFDLDLKWCDEPLALCLFLYEQGDIDIATSFWNCRWFLAENKLLMPKQIVLNDLENYISLFSLAIPSIEAIYVAVNISRNEAEHLCINIKNIFKKLTGREIKVWVELNDFCKIKKVSIYTNSPKIISQRVHSDDSVRFLPEIPSGLETQYCAFGYDAELDSETGNKLIFPRSSAISTLLSNSFSNIKSYNEKEEAFSSLSIRATDIGISGIAFTSRECKFYIHSDTIIISEYLKSSVGVNIKANRHTQYAESFIKRLGGLEKIYSLIYEGGIEILLQMCSKKSEQSGQNIDHLTGFLNKIFEIKQEESIKIINLQLPKLLECGLVKRGISLKCPVCDLETWYSISSLGEFIKCQGCLIDFQLDLKKYAFSYIPNQLSLRLIESGGIAVLKTADILLTATSRGFIQFGGELFEPGQKNNFAEIDLIVVAGEICIIAECKYFTQLYKKEQVEEALSSEHGLEKAIKIAGRIGAKIVILGISTNLENSDQKLLENLFKGVAKLKEDAQKKGIGVDLWLTGVNKQPFTSINLKKLVLIDTEHQSKSVHDTGVGDLPTNYFRDGNPFNQETLRLWKSQLLS